MPLTRGPILPPKHFRDKRAYGARSHTDVTPAVLALTPQFDGPARRGYNDLLVGPARPTFPNPAEGRSQRSR